MCVDRGRRSRRGPPLAAGVATQPADDPQTSRAQAEVAAAIERLLLPVRRRVDLFVMRM